MICGMHHQPIVVYKVSVKSYQRGATDGESLTEIDIGPTSGPYMKLQPTPICKWHRSDIGLFAGKSWILTKHRIIHVCITRVQKCN